MVVNHAIILQVQVRLLRLKRVAVQGVMDNVALDVVLVTTGKTLFVMVVVPQGTSEVHVRTVREMQTGADREGRYCSF